MKTITTFLLALLATAALFAQPYPADSYEINGDTLVKWTGDETSVDMQADPVLKNIKHIGDNLFAARTALSFIAFPESLESIGGGAFYKCSGLKGSLTIPNNVKSIGISAFQKCSGFKGTLTIGNNVTSIGEDAFEGCSGFTGDLTIPNSVTFINKNAFSNCSGFTGDLTIGNSVKNINWRTFAHCSGFRGALTIGSSVRYIDDYAFLNCYQFTYISFLGKTPPLVGGVTGLKFERPLIVPEGSLEWYKEDPYWNKFASISEHSISNSYELSADSTTLLCWKGKEEIIDMQTDIILKNVKHIAGNAFAKPNGGSNSDSGKNYDENKTLKTIVFPEGLETIGDHAFVKCTALSGKLNIPNTVTSIGVHAFRESAFSDTLTIPNSVKNIAAGAFAYCSGFTDLAIGNSLKKISDYAFYKCSGLREDLKIGEKIEEIGKEAFFQCTGLNSTLSIGENLKKIGEKAFTDCPFTTIRILATMPPIVQKNNAGLNTALPLIVPEGSLEEYKKHPYWKKFASITGVAVPSSINKLEITDSELRFYPSPVKNLLTVDCEKAIEAYALYSGTGVLLQSKKTKGKQLQIDMENYPSGIYFLRLLSKEGTKTIKLIKK